MASLGKITRELYMHSDSRFYSCPAVFVACLALSVFVSGADGAIKVTNFDQDEVVRYSTPLIEGTLTDTEADSVTITNASSGRSTRAMNGLAHQGRFKTLVDLVPGLNDLTISAGKETFRLQLTFKPQTNPYIIRAVYYTDKDGDTGYDSPVENDTQDIKGKLSTAMLLMQSFSAQRMKDMGFGRKTFNVELQDDGTVKVHIVKGDQEPGSGLNGRAMREAVREQAGGEGIHCLVILGRGCGYSAVGGGGIALMGGTCIYTWPDNIRDAQAAFMDGTLIDGKQFHVDAIGRDAFWANTSTTIGASLHEIDHTFGLPHSMDPHCIMTRGIDRFNRFFTLYEPPSKKRKEPYEFNDDEIARYSKAIANNLAVTRFFALDKRAYKDGDRPKMSYNKDRNEITITSEVGIGYVSCELLYARPGTHDCIGIDPNKPAPKEIILEPSDWKRFEDGTFQVRAIDIDAGVTTDRDPLNPLPPDKRKKK